MFRACHIAGAEWIHIDVCDGGSVAPGALTIGAGTIAAIRKVGEYDSVSRLNKLIRVFFKLTFSLFVYMLAPSTFLDVHVAVDHPMEVISAIIDALKDDMGTSHKARITFQFESIPTVHEVIQAATTIRNAGWLLTYLVYMPQ